MMMMMILKKLHFCWIIVLCCVLLLASVSCSKKSENSGDELVEIINKNRTGQKLPLLYSSPGLGCLALQYAKNCSGNCSTDGTSRCHAREDDFIEIFAPNCGLELPTFGTISAQIVGCQSRYVKPPEAFSGILFRDKHMLSLLSNKTHTGVGVGLIGGRKGSFFWCVLFTSDKKNSTFVLDDLGVGVKQKKGCFNGINVPCSGGSTTYVVFNFILTILCVSVTSLR